MLVQVVIKQDWINSKDEGVEYQSFFVRHGLGAPQDSQGYEGGVFKLAETPLVGIRDKWNGFWSNSPPTRRWEVIGIYCFMSDQ